MTENHSRIPLFPLKAVLFPDGRLPLKVLEARYIVMIQACIERNVPFGIVLIKTGESDNGNSAEDIGCLAHIEHAMPGPGMVSIRVRGGERFRIVEQWMLSDQRMEAQIEMLPADAQIPISAMHVSCAKALKIVIDNILVKGRSEHGNGFKSPFSELLRFDDAAWVANRWSELLPIPLKARQKLMELDSAQNRLSVVHQYLQQHKIL